MNVYEADASVNQGCGCCYDSFEETVVANSESEALGFLLAYHTDTSADDWEIRKVDTTIAGIFDKGEE